MGFFDRLAGKPASPAPGSENAAPAATFDPSVSGVAPRLITAREKLEQNDLPGAMAIYEEVLAGAGDRADVLVTISGDLGATGHIPQIIELVAPRYDAMRHGPATGINLIRPTSRSAMRMRRSTCSTSSSPLSARSSRSGSTGSPTPSPS